jgi:hypothetical protein
MIPSKMCAKVADALALGPTGHRPRVTSEPAHIGNQASQALSFPAGRGLNGQLAIVLEHVQPDHGGKVGMRSLLVNVREKVAERQLSYPRNLFEALPELILHSEACLVVADPN